MNDSLSLMARRSDQIVRGGGDLSSELDELSRTVNLAKEGNPGSTARLASHAGIGR